MVHLTQTYISMSTVNRTVSLINRHSVPLQYRWTASGLQEALDHPRSVGTETDGQLVHLSSSISRLKAALTPQQDSEES